MLGELLEVMHTCTDRWTTLRADVHEWQDDDGLAAASQARSASLGARHSEPPGLPAGRHCTGVHERSLTLVATADRGVRLKARAEDDGTRLVVVRPDSATLVVEQTARPRPRRPVSRLRRRLRSHP